LFCRAPENLGITNRSNTNEINCIFFVAAQPTLLEFTTKATETKFILSCRAAKKLLKFANKNNSIDGISFCRAEKTF
jgi:hypothetical protein